MNILTSENFPPEADPPAVDKKVGTDSLVRPSEQHKTARQAVAPYHRNRYSVAMKFCFISIFTLALAVTGISVHGADAWLEPDCDRRVPITIKGDHCARDRYEAEVMLNFNALLGEKKVIAADSLRLHETQGGNEVPVDIAEDPLARDPSGNPTLRLRWNAGVVPAFGEKLWHLYFRSVPSGDQKAWRTLSVTFDSSLPPNVLIQTSFEQGRPDKSATKGKPDLPEVVEPLGEDKAGSRTERIWTDETARTGKKSLKISRVSQPDAVPAGGGRPYWCGTLSEVKESEFLRVSIWVKINKLVGAAYVALCLDSHDGKQKQLAHAVYSTREVSANWKELTGQIIAPPGAQSVSLVLMLSDGSESAKGRSLTNDVTFKGDGEVFFDDLTISRLFRGDLPAELEVQKGEIQQRGK